VRHPRATAALLTGGCLLLGALLWPCGGGPVVSPIPPNRAKAMDLSSFSPAPLPSAVDLVFLHHSIGSQLLADPGPDDEQAGVHPNGGGLRRALTDSRYRVHEATYGSRLGEHTDLFDWLPKFRDSLPDILRLDRQDTLLPNGVRNRVVMFKSCFPNNYFAGPGSAPGNPEGPALTVANAQATLRALLPIFAQHPDTLFVYLTTPPLVGLAPTEPAWKWLAKTLLGKPTAPEKLAQQGRWSRDFARWATAADGWLLGYALKNVVAFDYFDVLTDEGASDFLRHPSGGGRDNHPNAEGNQRAARAMVPFLNRAVRRCGLVTDPG
jgi:hypothetical protein